MKFSITRQGRWYKVVKDGVGTVGNFLSRNEAQEFINSNRNRIITPSYSTSRTAYTVRRIDFYP